MPKSKNPISPAEQRRRFEEEVRKRIAAGDLNPTDAAAALDNLVRESRKAESPGAA